MKNFVIAASLVAIALIIYWLYPRQDPQQEQFVTQSTIVIKQLAGGLKKELVAAISNNGIPEAIQTCKIQAPIITAQSHADSPLTIRRTSLRVRNPANAPDAWEQSVLEKFEQQLTQGTPIEQLTFAEITNPDGVKQRRFMRAIPTQDICLNCHGAPDHLTPDVKSILNSEYPDDRATGFAIGDIRGAFSVSQTIKN